MSKDKNIENDQINDEIIDFSEIVKKDKKKKKEKEVKPKVDELKVLRSLNEILTNENDNLKDEIEKIKNIERTIRVDFFNYKRRNVNAEQEAGYRALYAIGLDLIEYLDNLERAIVSEEKEKREGLILLHKQFTSILKKYNIKEMQVEVGDKFNPEMHDAQGTTPDIEKENDTICWVSAKGYMFDQNVLRHAKVIVIKNEEIKEENNDNQKK